jgi:pilus assembly protein Flp/PilA
MRELIEMLKGFWNEEEGATVVEYAVLVALIIVALLGVIAFLTGAISTVFSNAASAIGG